MGWYLGRVVVGGTGIVFSKAGCCGGEGAGRRAAAAAGKVSLVRRTMTPADAATPLPVPLPPPSPFPLRPFTPPSVALLSPSPVTAAIHHSARHSAYCLTGDKCTRFTRRAGLPLAGYPRSRMLPLLFTPP